MQGMLIEKLRFPFDILYFFELVSHFFFRVVYMCYCLASRFDTALSF